MPKRYVSSPHQAKDNLAKECEEPKCCQALKKGIRKLAQFFWPV